jgi:GAF domain-containing protein
MASTSTSIAPSPTAAARAHVPAAQGVNGFIRICEVWAPSRDRMQLRLVDGLYGSLGDLRAISERTTFCIGEGLPGRVWAAGRPVVLADFRDSWFAGAPRAAGLASAVALPVFAGEYLLAVVVLICGREDAQVGAIELWHNDAAKSPEMRLIEGYYENADTFAFNALHTRFPRGYGLPGRAWKARAPLIVKDLMNSQSFLRWEQAVQIGVNRGLGIPYLLPTGQSFALSFLSARDTPMARRLEIWVPNEARDALFFHSGDCDRTADLAGEYAQARIGRSDGLIGQAWQTGLPTLREKGASDTSAAGLSAATAGLDAAMAIPFIQGGMLTAVIAWYF